MADVITRLKVESQEYDAKIKRASDGILHLERTVRTAGESFLSTWKDEQKFVAALGNMETISKSARGKISELTSAFTDLSMVYKRMSDEEKASPFGKGLASSLDQLKSRINEAKKDLADVNKELGDTGKESKSTGNIIDQLAGQFGMSTKALMGWGAALAAGKVALDVAKDAFFASEANIDDWGRTVESSKMLYEGFLNALNTGDISGYIQNMNSISQAAIKAYNELDRLGTMKTINAPSTSGRQTEITRLQGMLRSGRAVDSLTGGKSYAEDGAVLTKAQKQQVADDLKALLKESRDTAQQEIDQATSSINALYEEQATVLGMNTDEFRNGTKNMQEFDKVLEGAKKYREFEQQHTTTVQTTSGTVGATYTSSHRDNAVNPYEQFKAWSLFKDDGPMYQRLVQEIQKRDQATQQFYGLVNQSYRGINRAEGVRVGGTTTPQTNQQKATAKYEQAMSDYQQALEEAALAVKSGQADTVAAKKKELSAAESLWKAIGDAREIYDSDELKNAQEDAAKKVIELGGSVTALVETQKKAQEAARKLTAAQEKAATAYQQMQQALATNDLKAYNTALKQYQTAQSDVQRLQASLPELPKKQTVEVEYIVTGDTMNVLDELKKIEGFHFDDKTMTVTFDTADAMRQAEDLQGYKFEPKQVPVEVEHPKPVQVPLEMSYTEGNMSAFLASLKERIANADVGSELYKNLTAQITDAQTLSTLISEAVKRGIDVSTIDPQQIWSKIFGENPGDYITEEQWKAAQEKLNEYAKKNPIKVNFESGTAEGKGKEAEEKRTISLGDMAKNVLSITRSLNDLGVEIPEGLTKVLSTMNIITTILGTINTLMGVTAATSAIKSIPIIGTFLNHGGVVPHAANGYYVPGTHYSGDVTPVMANAGELVLNKSSQSNLASDLTNAESLVKRIFEIENPMLRMGRDYMPDIRMQQTPIGESAIRTIVDSDQIKLVLLNGAQSRGMTIGQYLEF